MSEYQYYEWQTVDRLLTLKEQADVNALSSHIEVSASKAVVTYNWSDFRHDPKQVLLEYFDAFFYLANWGSLQLMFRFPKGLLNQAEIEPYCDGEFVTFETTGQYQVLNIEINAEDGESLEMLDADLSDFIQLRADLLEGDYRFLYLAWLLTSTFESMEYEGEEYDEYDEEYQESEIKGENARSDFEPPVPPGLKKLTPALENFIRVFGIDPYLVKAAAEASPDVRAPLAIDYRELIARLPRAECDEFLTRLVEGDPGVRLDLRKRLKQLQPMETRQAATGSRPLQEMLDRAEQIEKAEAQRRAEEARRKHIAEMKALAQKEPQVWQQVDLILEQGQKIASVYDEATALLDQLKQLADFQDTRDIFLARVRALADKYGSRPSLIKRWNQQGWV
jgi:hypothetical protein